MDELEDFAELPDAEANLEEELFGQGSDEEEPTPLPPRRASARAAAEPTPPSADERRRRLLSLAKRKAQEHDEVNLGKSAAKNKKLRKEREGRSRRGEGGSGGAAASGDRRASGGGGGGAVPNVLDEMETAADLEFIDDEGADDEGEVGPGSDSGADEPPPGGYFPPEEAEEVPEGMEEEPLPGEEEPQNDVDAILAKRAKRRSQAARDEDDAQAQRTVDALVAEMDVAAEADAEAVTAKRPALHKLKMLKKVETVLLQKKHHEIFCAAGLGVMSRWMQPYEDGTMPNANVRTTCLRLVAQLPIDTANEYMKGLLTKSGLGRIVMFMAKNPDETPVNTRTAKELVHRWSRPLFWDEEREATKRQLRQKQLLAQRAADQKRQEEVERQQATRKQQQAALRPGDAGYRFHASMPPTAKLDYILQPEQRPQEAAEMESGDGEGHLVAMPPGGGAGRASATPTKLAGRLRDVERRRKGGTMRAGRVDVEGRSLGS